jgi:parvulin-like peptidyl-prolyl isomerase
MPPDVVAQIGERSITVEQWRSALDRLGPDAGPEQKKQLLEDLIQREALLVQARRAGYHQKPELLARYDQVVSAEFKEDKLRPLLAAAADATDDEIAAYYRSHSSQYISPEACRIGVICFQVSSKAAADRRAEAAQRAGTVLAEARQTNEEGFARLTQQYSEDQATRYRGGDAGWMAAGSSGNHWPAAVLDAAAVLAAPGDFAPLVETETGLYIVRLLQKRSASRRDLAEVRDGIRYLVIREKQQEAGRHFHQQLRGDLPIDINQPLLQSISIPTKSVSATPPALPGG